MDDFLLKIVIFLLASVIVVPIAKFFKLGTVLGYLIAGVLIGPYMLGYLGVGDQTSLRNIAEFGVVMMLFLIGLELKPSFLWKLRVPILGMGGAQMLLCTVLIALIAWAFGQTWKTSLAIGMILALSSTAIVVQTLSEKNLLGTKAGRSSFSVLLFQDISVIPILAILPLLASFKVVDQGENGHGTAISQWLLYQPGYVRMLAVLIAVLLIITVGHFLASRLFRLIASSKISEIFTATALFIVIGVALLMESVGLSAALGTFLAGVMLADSEYRHEIELSIEPFKGLLLGLFFISVGASINFDLFMYRPWAVISMVAGIVIIKFIAMYGIARLFKHNHAQALLFACAMAQGGEFAFVLFSFTADNLILPPRLTESLTLAVTISMLITPLLMIAYEIISKRRGLSANTQQPNPEFEHDNPVIIAGYGRFNQIIGRLLMANGFGCTILENNPKVIETLKRFGQRVYYGDATRPDLLELAGASKAKIIIIGLKEPDKVDLLIETVKKHFPHLKIFVRAIDRVQAYRLIEHDVTYFQREMLDSSLEVGAHALVALGYHPYTAHRQARIFKANDEKMLYELYQAWKDDPHLERGQQPGEQYISKTRALSDALSAVLRHDRYSESLTVADDLSWEPAPTEEELIERALAEEMKAEKARNAVEEAVAAAQEGVVAEQVERAAEAVKSVVEEAEAAQKEAADAENGTAAEKAEDDATQEDAEAAPSEVTEKNKE